MLLQIIVDKLLEQENASLSARAYLATLDTLALGSKVHKSRHQMFQEGRALQCLIMILVYIERLKILILQCLIARMVQVYGYMINGMVSHYIVAISTMVEASQ